MPTTYTHYYFARECRKCLPADTARLVERERPIFDIGAQGPDIFFYYKPLIKNTITARGLHIHFHPAADFFVNCNKVLQTFDVPFVPEKGKTAGAKKEKTYILGSNKPKQEAMFAYILGFLSHFVLDATCHSYVEKKKDVSRITHNHVEAAYDAFLMRRDGIRPSQFDRSFLVSPVARDAHLIACFHGIHYEIMLDILRSTKKYLHLFYSPRGWKAGTLRALSGAATPLRVYADLYVKDEEEPSCADSNLRLDKLKARALSRYEALVHNLTAFFAGAEELHPFFRHNFEADPDERDIPIFSFEEEKEYVLAPDREMRTVGKTE